MAAQHRRKLQNLLSTHGEILRPLLGDLWPVRPFKTERFGPLIKFTLGQMPDGMWAMLHRIGKPDTGPPHCHPCDMMSHVIKGSYVERVWHSGPAELRVETVLRESLHPRLIAADCIHSIVALPEGECWTLVFAGPVVRKWKHYPELGQQTA